MREVNDEQRILCKAFFRLTLFSSRVKNIRYCLEGIERNANRQDDIQHRGMGTNNVDSKI